MQILDTVGEIEKSNSRFAKNTKNDALKSKSAKWEKIVDNILKEYQR